MDSLASTVPASLPHVGQTVPKQPLPETFRCEKVGVSGFLWGFKSLLLHQILLVSYILFRVVAPLWGNRWSNSPVSRRALERSSSPGNEPRDARVYNRIEPDSRSDSLSNLFDGVIGKSRQIKIFLDVTDACSCGERSRATLHRPG
jgi:hypothetical protein